MATAKKTEATVKLSHFKDHKNVVQFRSDDENSPITGGVYLAKTHALSKVKSITITVTS